MKSIKTMLLIATISVVSSSCSKSGSGNGSACETNGTTKATFKNTASFAVHLELAASFDAQNMPVGLVFAADLAPGATITKEFKAGTYYHKWNTNKFLNHFEVCQEYNIP